jgi:hypothetical protein
MKTRFGALCASLLAAFAFGVLGSASASAAECHGTVESGALALCVEGTEQLGETAFTGKTKAETEMEFRIGSWGNDDCPANTATGHFSATDSKLELKSIVIKFSGCLWEGGHDCTTGSLILDGGEGKGTGPGLIGIFNGTGEVNLEGSGTEKQFTYVYVKSIGGICGSSGNYRIVGSEKCELPESTVEAVKHVLQCSREELLYFGTKVKFRTTDEIQLSSGKKWSLYKA